jgi:hypothetical protein
MWMGLGMGIVLACAACDPCETNVGEVQIGGGLDDGEYSVASGTSAPQIIVPLSLVSTTITGVQRLGDECVDTHEVTRGTVIAEPDGGPAVELTFISAAFDYEGTAQYASRYRFSLTEPSGETHEVFAYAPELFELTLSRELNGDLVAVASISPADNINQTVLLEFCGSGRVELLRPSTFPDKRSTITIPSGMLSTSEGDYRVTIVRVINGAVAFLRVHADYVVDGRTCPG